MAKLNTNAGTATVRIELGTPRISFDEYDEFALPYDKDGELDAMLLADVLDPQVQKLTLADLNAIAETVYQLGKQEAA